MTRRDPASPTLTRKRRCAVYTRKSTDEDLEKEFNSLDAQRESCEAYIASQRSEGWVLVHDRYDDGGVSGGTLERPAASGSSWRGVKNAYRAKKASVFSAFSYRGRLGSLGCSASGHGQQTYRRPRPAYRGRPPCHLNLAPSCWAICSSWPHRGRIRSPLAPLRRWKAWPVPCR